MKENDEAISRCQVFLEKLRNFSDEDKKSKAQELIAEFNCIVEDAVRQEKESK